ncbi:hypothetical protein ACES2I_02040 [Bdellovibrio bacteriovorus]|uniref:hypothetical protein n=1 Tax=Bdellovibrio bacteriovorus TaxID=959 RepID=UPI0035A617DE
MKNIVVKPLIIFCLLAPVSVMAQEFEESRIITAQMNDMQRMIHEIAELQDQADVEYEHDGVERVGQLGKIIVEAEILRESAELSESGDEVNQAWIEVSRLTKLACQIARGEEAKECK